MQFENQPDQIQPQSAPAGLTAAGLLHAVKRREELGQSFFRDGNTRVFNRHRMRIQQNADARALRGIEDGVHQNIVQRVGQEILVSPIVIGNPLKSSPDFPPLCTERAAFTALGAPSNSDVRASNTTYTLRYSFKFKD